MIDRIMTRTTRVPTTQLGARLNGRFTDADIGPNVQPAKAAEVSGSSPQDMMKMLLGADLQRVESMLAEVLRSQYADVNDLAGRAASLGGKRLRPCLSLLSALAVGRCQDDSIRVGVTVELVHAASLVHDDVLDNAALRRHQPTIHAQVGAHSSIVLGDYLFTRAYGLAAQCRSTLAARNIAAAASELCEGELRQHSSIGNWNISEAEYFDILRQKTGELCAVSCRLGAWSGGGNSAAAHSLSRFGRKLGVAFQVVDDWLDLWGTEQVGKTLGTDLLQRKPTLPLIRLLATRAPSERAALIAMLDDAAQHASVRQLLDASDAANYSLDRARQLINSALNDLRQLPLSPARQCLEGIAQLCISRTA
ncbi:MAG: polyprenyl synthetase family protein [Pirellulaceae bacterium]|nr:polyprenyl synthetase family protein [Pirellulaceae bacterium]